MINGESFEDDLRRVNGIRDSLAATRSLGETMIALDARFLLSFIDKLWKVYAKETQENQALQSLWDDMQQGLLELFGEPVQDSIELVGVIEGLRDRHAKELERLRAWAKELEESGIASAPQPEVEPSPEPTPNGRCKCIFCGAGFVMWGDTSVHERSCSKNPVNAVSRTELKP